MLTVSSYGWGSMLHKRAFYLIFCPCHCAQHLYSPHCFWSHVLPSFNIDIKLFPHCAGAVFDTPAICPPSSFSPFSGAGILYCHICWTLIMCFVCYLSKCSKMCTHGSCHCKDQCWHVCSPVDILCFSERGKSNGSQGPDCPLNFLPLRQITRDHAGHPSCWVCVLSRPFPAVQTMPEDNPSTEVEWRRCSHCICQVRPPKKKHLCGLTCEHLMDADMASGYSTVTPLILYRGTTVCCHKFSPSCFSLRLVQVFAWHCMAGCCFQLYCFCIQE